MPSRPHASHASSATLARSSASTVCVNTALAAAPSAVPMPTRTPFEQVCDRLDLLPRPPVFKHQGTPLGAAVTIIVALIMASFTSYFGYLYGTEIEVASLQYLSRGSAYDLAFNCTALAGCNVTYLYADSPVPACAALASRPRAYYALGDIMTLTICSDGVVNNGVIVASFQDPVPQIIQVQKTWYTELLSNDGVKLLPSVNFLNLFARVVSLQLRADLNVLDNGARFSFELKQPPLQTRNSQWRVTSAIADVSWICPGSVTSTFAEQCAAYLLQADEYYFKNVQKRRNNLRADFLAPLGVLMSFLVGVAVLFRKMPMHAAHDGSFRHSFIELEPADQTSTTFTA